MGENSIVTFLKDIKEKGIRVSVENNELDIKAPKGTMTEEILRELRSRKSELLAYLSGGHVENSNDFRIENVTCLVKLFPSCLLNCC